MHASIHDLLMLRDGEPIVAETRAHVARCDDCRRCLADLSRVREQLAALPPLPPRKDLWGDIERAAARPSSASRRIRRRMAAALAASVLIVAVTTWAVVGGVGAPALNRVAATRAEAPSVTLLQRRSSRLEAMLRDLRRHDAVMNAGAANTIANLEDSVAAVDFRLNRGAARGMPQSQARRLWRRRVGLMRSLVTVRYVQARSR